MCQLEKQIDYLFTHRNTLSAIESCSYGASNMEELSELIKKGKLSNRTNREVELDIKKDYQKKAHHLIRFCSGISRKGCLEISILRNTIDLVPIGYISDCGTFLSLSADGGEFFNRKMLNPIEWLAILDNIKKKYPTEDMDKTFIQLIRTVLDNVPEQKLTVSMSWSEIVNNNLEIKDYYFNKPKLNWDLRLLSTTQHSLDMRNANNPENAWNGFNFYTVPLKHDSRYFDSLVMDEVIELSRKNFGKLDKDRIMGSQKTGKKAEVVKLVIHPYLAYKYCETTDDMVKFYDWLHFYEKGAKDDDDCFLFWNEKQYQKLVSEVKLSDLQDFVTKILKPIYECEHWNMVDDVVDDLEEDYCKSINETENKDIQKFNLKKPLNGLWMLGYAAWAKKKYKNGIDTTVTKIVNQYTTILENNIDVNSIAQMPAYKAFGSKLLSANTAEVRSSNILKPLVESMEVIAKRKMKDRAVEEVLLDKSKKLFSKIVDENRLPILIKAFPLAFNGSVESSDMRILNLKTLKGTHFTHLNDKKNQAEDGFIAFVEDNLNKKYKHFDWSKELPNPNTRGADYFGLLYESNSEKYKEMKDGIAKDELGRTLPILQFLSQENLKVEL